VIINQQPSQTTSSVMTTVATYWYRQHSFYEVKQQH